RVYSGTGGAYSLCFFDALLYDDQTLGGALRQGKNFLLAYALLKEKRLGTDARLTGANVRSAWAFALWGDPTLRLPRPQQAPRPPLSAGGAPRGQGHHPGAAFARAGLRAGGRGPLPHAHVPQRPAGWPDHPAGRPGRQPPPGAVPVCRGAAAASPSGQEAAA